MTINWFSVLYSTPVLFTQHSFFNKKGGHLLKSQNKAARRFFVSHLVCLAIAAQPFMVSSVAAKSDKAAAHSVTEETVGGKPYSVTRLVIKATPEQVWSVLADYSNAPSVFPQLKHCQVIEDKGTTKIVKHIIEPTGLPGRYKYVLELKEQAP
ncbi:MAG TPA: SRPBCC family protein, partial [Chroococcales cyanobacterium]